VATQAEHFDAIADAYDGAIPPHVALHLVRRRVALACSLMPAGSVLDVGCGTGSVLAAMPAGYRLHGVDASANMLARARGRGLDVTLASADALPFDDASFDLVMAHALLHHLIGEDRVRGGVREMARVARPGGAVLIWDHNPLNPYWKVLMARVPQDRGDERLVPARRLVAAAHEAGLADVRLRRMTFVPDFTPRRAMRAAAALERGLERVPGLRAFAAHNVLSARRTGTAG